MAAKNSQREDKFQTWRLRSSYLTTIVSISLVLFLLGIMGLLIINANKLSNHVKENIGLTVFLNDNAKDLDILRLQERMDASDFVKESKYVTKAAATEELKTELGEDFVEILGYTPLLASIDVRLFAKYANVDSIEVIKAKLQQYDLVKEVHYQKSVVNLINENVRKISIFILGFSLLLFIISAALINNTIRLSIYSKRYLINTMKLIGATEAFIRKPFLLKGALHGLVGGLIAIFMLLCVVYLALSELRELISTVNLLVVIGVVCVLGVLISGASTFFAVNKYLRIDSSELHHQ